MIFCCGENLIDIVPKNNSTDYNKACVGGSPLNTAIGLGVLKVPTYFFSRISNDFFGNKIITYLKKNNVNVSLVQRSKDPTTIGFVSKKNKPEFSFYANNTADTNIKNYNFSINIKKKITLAHFSSISLVLKPGSETYFKLMKDLKKYSLISIDPNIRPSLINNKLEFKTRFKNFIKIADIIKLSIEDYNYIEGTNNFNNIIPKWIKKNNLSIVVLTNGSSGSVVYTENFQIKIKAKKIKISDTVGAGDTYHAGMISYLYKNKLLTKKKLKEITKSQWLDCLNFATKAASICCSREGCNPPTYKEIQDLI